MRSNLAKSFVAVFTGNVLYFFLLMPLLPPRVRHEPGALDLGLLVDFWLCLVVYGVLELWSRRKQRPKPQQKPE